MAEETAASSTERAGSHADFWDERYQEREDLFGAEPNAFVLEETRDLPPGGRVLDIAAGEGRNAIHLAREGHHVTALDFSAMAIERLRRKVSALDADLEVVQADILEWESDEPFDCIVITFLQLLPEQRPKLYERIQTMLAPAGRFVGLFFRPEQITEGYTSGGPPSLERMITPKELRKHFPEQGIRRCDPVEVVLRDGILSGPAAVIQFRFDQEWPVRMI